MVADDLLGLLEGHHQRLALLARCDIEAVQREIVLVEPDMHGLEALQSSEPRLARDQPLDCHARKGARPGGQRQIVRRPGNAAVERRDEALQCVLRRVEQKVGLDRIVHRLALT
ncbi:hypothetical protein D9M72_460010 [compost metagenome]